MKMAPWAAVKLIQAVLNFLRIAKLLQTRKALYSCSALSLFTAAKIGDPLRYIGIVRNDPAIRLAVFHRAPVCLADVGGRVSAAS